MKHQDYPWKSICLYKSCVWWSRPPCRSPGLYIRSRIHIFMSFVSDKATPRSANAFYVLPSRNGYECTWGNGSTFCGTCFCMRKKIYISKFTWNVIMASHQAWIEGIFMRNGFHFALTISYCRSRNFSLVKF